MVLNKKIIVYILSCFFSYAQISYAADTTLNDELTGEQAKQLLNILFPKESQEIINEIIGDRNLSELSIEELQLLKKEIQNFAKDFRKKDDIIV